MRLRFVQQHVRFLWPLTEYQQRALCSLTFLTQIFPLRLVRKQQLWLLVQHSSSSMSQPLVGMWIRIVVFESQQLTLQQKRKENFISLTNVVLGAQWKTQKRIQQSKHLNLQRVANKLASLVRLASTWCKTSVAQVFTNVNGSYTLGHNLLAHFLPHSISTNLNWKTTLIYHHLMKMISLFANSYLHMKQTQQYQSYYIFQACEMCTSLTLHSMSIYVQSPNILSGLNIDWECHSKYDNWRWAAVSKRPNSLMIMVVPLPWENSYRFVIGHDQLFGWMTCWM